MQRILRLILCIFQNKSIVFDNKKTEPEQYTKTAAGKTEHAKVFCLSPFCQTLLLSGGSKSWQANKETRKQALNNSSQQELDPSNDFKPPKTPTGATQNTPATATTSPDKQGKQEEDKEKAKAEKEITEMESIIQRLEK